MSVPTITPQELGGYVLRIINVKETDYSTDEKIDDIAASSMELLKNVFTPWRALLSFNASKEVVLFESSSTETISQIVEKHFAKVEEKDLIKEKLSYISDKVQKYAQKMNLGKVDLYFSLEENDLAGAFKFFNTPNCEDQFTSEEFDRVFSEYDLFRFVEQPGLLLSPLANA